MSNKAIDGLEGLVSVISGVLKERRELGDNALRSVSNALDETYFYYRDIDAGKPRDKEREAQLAKYWSAAAIPMRHIDKDLALACDCKAEYWVNPEHWDNEKVEKTGIALEKVRNQYRRLLNKKSKVQFDK